MSQESDLLEELREVDEKTWEVIQYGVRWGNGLDECRLPYGSMSNQMAQDFIQGCIQRAIAAKKWTLKQHQTGGDDGIITRITIPLSEDGLYIRRAHRCEYSRYGDTQAAAILAAYIEAVRAMQ